MSFVDNFKAMTDVKMTENGGFSYKSTGGAVLDFFAVVGGMRKREEQDIVNMYLAARVEDKELADKIVLYSRDIRNGGLGERRVGRILMRELAKIDPTKVERNLQTFVDNGRFDDLYDLVGTPVESAMWQYMKKVLVEDSKAMKAGKPITLAAKWMKSINTSSNESKRLAKKFCTVAGITEKTYRKTLAALRKYTNVVETKMSARDWQSIDFEAVPSYAMKQYGNAFGRHCPESFSEYKEKLVSGEAKINAGTLYPYETVYNYLYNNNFDKDIAQAQWDNLKNYFKEGSNVVCCADVSGSMIGMPMAASLGLAMYCAQHNSGPYHGLYLTFTNQPRFFKLDERAGIEWNIKQASKNVGFNTNLDGMFDAIFEIAEKAGEAPEALLIISDMEIDYYMRPNRCDDIVDKWVKKFESIGLELPKLILWNCAARQNTYLARSNNPYVSFVSGVSAGTFSNLIELINYSAYEAMVKILNKYEFV